jgi:ferrochelatase
MDDVVPFIENVLRRRNVPRERIQNVAQHYHLFDGISPINEENRRLIKALTNELSTHGPKLPIYWGNRNWHPLLTDTVRQMAVDGIKHALAFVTAAYSSYSSCRQYLENIECARQAAGSDTLRIDKIRVFFDHPLFIKANSDHLQNALDQLPMARRAGAQVVYTAHSIPVSMARNCRYEAQLLEASRLVSAAVSHPKWNLVYQSRSGSPEHPWLGPDIAEYLPTLISEGVRDVVIQPLGFVCDHMEVVYDLDIVAKGLCEQLGLNFIRTPTAGTHPAFVKMIRELISERVNGRACRSLGEMEPELVCGAPGCCESGSG